MLCSKCSRLIKLHDSFISNIKDIQDKQKLRLPLCYGMLDYALILPKLLISCWAKKVWH